MNDDIETAEEEREAEIAEMQELLTGLKEEHRRIDIEIKALQDMGVRDALKIGRMKKIKLSIKGQIVFLENQLTPDIIA